MNSISRRRLFIDLAFVGGALALAAGLAIAGKEQHRPGHSPSSDTPQHELAGKMMMAPPNSTGPTPAVRQDCLRESKGTKI
jgi:hypothetical protein